MSGIEAESQVGVGFAQFMGNRQPFVSTPKSHPFVGEIIEGFELEGQTGVLFGCEQSW